MVQKGYFQVSIPEEYRSIIEKIQNKKPELKSYSKVIEFSLNLLDMQLKGEILRLTKDDVQDVLHIKFEKIKEIAEGQEKIWKFVPDDS